MNPSDDPISELSILSDHITSQHAGQLARRSARKSGNLDDLPAFRRDQKVKQILELMRRQDFSLADFIEGVFVSSDPIVSRYAARFLDHSHGMNALDTMLRSSSPVLQDWLIREAGNILNKEVREMQKQMHNPLKSYTRRTMLSWSMAGTEQLIAETAPELSKLLAGMVAARRQITSNNSQSQEPKLARQAGPLCSTPPPHPSPAHVHDPGPSTSPLPPSSPIYFDGESEDETQDSDVVTFHDPGFAAAYFDINGEDIEPSAGDPDYGEHYSTADCVVPSDVEAVDNSSSISDESEDAVSPSPQDAPYDIRVEEFAALDGNQSVGSTGAALTVPDTLEVDHESSKRRALKARIVSLTV